MHADVRDEHNSCISFVFFSLRSSLLALVFYFLHSFLTVTKTIIKKRFNAAYRESNAISVSNQNKPYKPT